jgi:hypothetical protein
MSEAVAVPVLKIRSKALATLPKASEGENSQRQPRTVVFQEVF